MNNLEKPYFDNWFWDKDGLTLKGLGSSRGAKKLGTKTVI